MPRLTVITNEHVYKHKRERFRADPGDYRTACDLCQECWQAVDVDRLAEFFSISESFLREQIDTIAESEGHLDDFHPPYETCNYVCDQCGVRLTGSDDEAASLKPISY